MPYIEKEGDYNVRITGGQFKESPRDDDPNAFILTLFAETPDGLHTQAHLYFNNRIIGGGRNQGLTNTEASVATLKSIGVPDGHPMNIQGAIEKGLEASFWMKNDEYNGKVYLKVASIKPATTAPLDIKDVDWNKVMSAYSSIETQQAPEPPKVGAPKQEPKPPEQTTVQPTQQPEPAPTQGELGDDDVPF